MVVTGSVVPWRCAICKREFSLDQGGLCAACRRFCCRDHLRGPTRNLICAACRDAERTRNEGAFPTGDRDKVSAEEKP